LNAGADIEAWDNAGRTWLFRQCSNLRIEHLQKCLDLGARDLTLETLKGAQWSHEAVSNGDRNLENRKYLIGIGVDPKAVDYFGNTLFHEAVQTGNIDLLEELSELRLDPDQANYNRSAPLHILCSMGLDEPIDVNYSYPVKYLLPLSKNIDAMDHDGIRPLHLAATISEYLVGELLTSGADPTSATFEGLKALHLAARARQCNIVGMLITALAEVDRPNLMSLINAKDKGGRTPLHYACRSGRPETVALLLNAGADPSMADERGTTALHACAEFEEEQELWNGYRKTTEKGRHDLWEFGHADLADPLVCFGGIKLEDTSRPFVCSGKELNKVLDKESSTDIRTSQDTARLDEIVDMLFVHVSKIAKNISWMTEAIRETIRQAEEAGNDYTASCFNQLQARFQTEATRPLSDFQRFGELVSKYRREVATRALHDSEIIQGSHNSGIFRRLLRMQEYTLVEEMFYRGSDFLNTTYDNETDLHLLARHGLRSF
jgi:ankyrin repeat protein